MVDWRMAKSIHLIRHAQSTFNAAWAETGIDPMHRDAPLSPLGLSQVEATRAKARMLPCDVVFTSPFTRAIQTAVGLFDGHAPIHVEHRHRECQSSSCDIGRPPKDLAEQFPSLIFDHIADRWWHNLEPNELGLIVEPPEVIRERVDHFREWLRERPEEAIVVVGHGTFFLHLTGHVFANCEILAWQP